MAGLLAGCDYASKLPDAPATLGYELAGPKPPSVTAPMPDPMLPDPTATVSLPPPPTPTLGSGLDTRALQVSPIEAERARSALALPPSAELPVPVGVAAGPDTFGPFPVADTGGYVAPPIDFSVAEADGGGGYGVMVEAPMQVQTEAQFPTYAPVSFEAAPPALPPAPAPIMMEPIGGPAAIASLPAQQPGITYNDAATAPALTYGTSLGQADFYSAGTPVETVALPMPSPAPILAPILAPIQASPLTVLHTRLDNGAVVKVHPVVGAPGATSAALARTIATELGASVDESALAFAPAVFDLRASASRDGGQAEAEWKLFSSTGALVGVFPESQSSGSWSNMGDDAVRAMGRRVADRLRRNANLRRATLTSVASAPPITSIDYSAVLPSGAPSLAPMPRQRPMRATISAPAPAVQVAMIQPLAPLQPVSAQPSAPQFVVNTQALQPTDSMAGAVPRRRPEGVRVAALSPVSPPPAALAPPPVQPLAALPPLQPISAPQPIAPLGAALPSGPIAAPAIPPAPSFDTLRASADGPRSLVFRGVRGAPGNGDQALGREVSRLLGQSGAQLAPDGTANALYLTADVSRTRNGGSDSIKILWHVEEADGTRVGQVVQENDVPAGALDSNWGEDAFYAAQGARDGIMELLRTSGAIDA